MKTAAVAAGVVFGALLARLIMALTAPVPVVASSISAARVVPRASLAVGATAAAAAVTRHVAIPAAKPEFVPNFPSNVPRIVCWVALRRPNDTERAMIVESWHGECDQTVFLSREGNASLLVRAHNYTMETRHGPCATKKNHALTSSFALRVRRLVEYCA